MRGVLRASQSPSASGVMMHGPRSRRKRNVPTHSCAGSWPRSHSIARIHTYKGDREIERGGSQRGTCPNAELTSS